MGDESALLDFDEHLSSVLAPFLAFDDFRDFSVDDFVELGSRARAVSIIARVFKAAEGHPRRRRGVGGEVRRRGSEVALFSGNLHLRGTADRINDSIDGYVELVDYKTGPVLEDGAPKPAYVRQLVAYACILLEAEPGTSLRAFLDNGERVSVDVGPEARAEFEALLRSVLSRVPVDGIADGSLASPGPDCVSCEFRPGCAAYLQIAPTWWTSPPEFRIPLDTWGTVGYMERTDSGNLTIGLRDAAGRHVRVVNVGARHSIGSDLEGSNIFAFALRAFKVQRRSDGRWLHPRALRDLSQDPYSRPAWQSVFHLA